MDPTAKHEPDGADPLAGWRDPPGIGRTLVVSSSVGVVLALIGVTAGMVAAGQVWQSALGLGLFVAFWGGLGFGSMVGGVLYLTRIEREAEELATRGAATEELATRGAATEQAPPRTRPARAAAGPLARPTADVAG